MAAAWLLLGIGMGFGLYDSAFGALGRIYGSDARSAITGITLIAGFASTVGWPLSSLGLETIGWRETCYAWAIAHIVIGLPLNLSLPRAASTPDHRGAGRQAAYSNRPNDGAVVVCVCRCMDRDFGDGRTSAADRRGFRSNPGAGRVCRHDDRSRPGRRPYHGSEPSQPFSSHRVHAPCLHHSSDRRVRDRNLRRRGRGGLRLAARRGQRHPDNCTRHASACDLWAGELRLPARIDRCAIPHLPGPGAACFWSLDRADGQAGGCGVGWPLSCGAGRPDGAAPIRKR